jgi:hypothetical protein
MLAVNRIGSHLSGARVNQFVIKKRSCKFGSILGGCLVCIVSLILRPL